MPKDNDETSEQFYQTSSYSQGFTTDSPSDVALAGLLASSFSGSEKDFSTYMAVLTSIGLKTGDTILDFGCSWGYGSWQLKQFGFKVTSYEINPARAEYARVKLGCEMIQSVSEMREKVKCMFSSHVIEHLPNPNLIWDVANKVLRSDGVIVCFCPNGDPGRESHVGVPHYDQIWGKVHPLLITPNFMASASRRHGFSARTYTSPYQLDNIRRYHNDAETKGVELCMIADRLPNV